MRKNIIRIFLSTAILAIVLTGCSNDKKSSDTGTTVKTQTQTSDTADLTGSVNVADSSLGKILVDKDGMTLYLFEDDKTDVSKCINSCASAWPPYHAEVSAGDGVDTSKLKEFTRDDGTKQLSYNGHPLYLWQGDSKAGDVTGQDVDDFYVVTPAGKAVEDDD